MRTAIKCLIITGIVIYWFSGCTKNSNTTPVIVPDTTKPTILITKPTAGQVFTNGSSILFQATLSDNEKLKSYDIAISQKISVGFVLKVVPTSVPFSYSKSSIILEGGKSQVVSLSDIMIPANSATTIVKQGTYNLKINCVDSSGNSASTTLEFVIN